MILASIRARPAPHASSSTTREPIGRASREFGQNFPRPGWVEHDAAEIWEVTHAVAGEALDDAGARPGELRRSGSPTSARRCACGIRETGEPLHRAIVWQDRRTAARCDELRAAGDESLVRERTGLVLDPYFSGTKIEWLLDNVDGLARARRAGARVFGTIDAWLIYKLCGELRDRPVQRVAHDAVRHPRGRWDAGAAGAVRGRRALALPRGAARVRGHRRRPTPRPCTATPCRSRASPATSRRPCSARRASIRDSARTRTGRARSCSSTPVRAAPAPAAGCSATVAWGIGDAAELRARGRDLRHRRRRPVAARRARDHRAGRRDRGAGGVA